MFEGGTKYDPLGEHHHLNIPRSCDLRPGQFVDRRAILNSLDPDEE